MRFVVCIVIGLLVGAIGTATLASILSQRNAYPRALMRVMQHQLGAARDAVRAEGCAGIAHRLTMLDVLSTDITTAFAQGTSRERVFLQYVDDLRKHVDNARRQTDECSARSQALTDIANACEACHRDYR